MMQGYDLEAAVREIAAALRKAGHRGAPLELETFARRAIEADMRYMCACGVLDEAGYMGEGEYDDDDAFEALLAELGEGIADEQALNELAMRLDTYMSAQEAFLARSGLMA